MSVGMEKLRGWREGKENEHFEFNEAKNWEPMSFCTITELIRPLCHKSSSQNYIIGGISMGCIDSYCQKTLGF